jgi:hypothetical protein
LLLPISVGPHADIKMPNAIEVWAPWMSEDEARRLLVEINAAPRWQRWPSPRTLGDRLRVSYGERLRLRVWSIAPYDVPEAGMALLRKQKKRQREWLRRQGQGAEPRAGYLANHRTSKEQPWLALGISRATYYRRIKQEQAGETGPCPIKLIETEHGLVSKEELGSKAGSCVRFPTATPAGLTGTNVTAGSSRWEAA